VFLRDRQAKYFLDNPRASAYLDALVTQDLRYLVHEYLNEHWTSFYFAEVAEMFGSAGLTFVGSQPVHVIDGKHGGNSSRWINHSCEPNCDSEIVGQRVFIRALRDLRPGEELSFDYRLTIEGRRTQRLERDYACHCGSANCRGTMLAPRRRASARG
jgi:hypothetical protein